MAGDEGPLKGALLSPVAAPERIVVVPRPPFLWPLSVEKKSIKECQEAGETETALPSDERFASSLFYPAFRFAPVILRLS